MSAVPSRSLDRLFECFEMIWTHQHGDPKTVKGDPEFANCVFEDSLESRNVQFLPVPVRRRNKNVKTEQKHRTVKDIFDRIVMHLRQKDVTRRWRDCVKGQFFGECLIWKSHL